MTTPQTPRPSFFSRASRRRLTMGLRTLLSATPQGFFIPYRYAASVPAPGTLPTYTAIEQIFAAAQPTFAAWLDRIDGFAADLERLGTAPPPEPRWQQDWFPRLDAAIAYTLIRTLAPKRLIEVGSGHSTRFFARAARDGATGTAITAIDPAPRADIATLPITLVPTTVQNADPALFATLAAGDVLMIDSSHIAMPGTDVDLLVNRVLPLLPTGVLVHIHDILLPDDYPASWGWRGYNEQQIVAPLLTGGGWDALFASHYVATRLHQHVQGTVLSRLPLKTGALETSLWLRKC
jgi:hypothetical protein